MYFLNKLTSFAKNANAKPAEETVSGSSSTVDASSVERADGENAGLDAVAGGEKVEREKSDSSDLSDLDPSIPDCFFDDVPETTSSGGISSEEGRDTDEGVATDVSNEIAENRDRPQKMCAQPSSRSSSINVISDDSQEKPEVVNADVTDFGSGNNVNDVNIAEAIVERVEKSEMRDDGRDEITEETNAEERGMSSEELLRASETDLNCSDSRTKPNGDDDDDVDSECLNEIANYFDRREELKILCTSTEDQSETTDLNFLEDDDNLSFSSRRLSSLSYLEDYLEKENDEAEARLAARRQARVEAREIRLRELERQQKEQEENADRAFDMSYVGDSILRTGRITPSTTAMNPRDRSMATANSYHSSRRSSEDSIDEGLTLRDIRHELKETEEKFKKAMIANAQLDNEKSALAYQVELLKDHFEDLEESHAQLTREHRDKCREHEQLKRAMLKLKEDLDFYKCNLLERDRLIAEYGLVVVDGEEDGEGKVKRTLISAQSAELLQQAGSGSLDVRLKKFAEEKNELQDEIRHLKLELEEERSKRLSDSGAGYGALSNGPLDEETNKILSDYKFKLQKAEQDVSTLQANVARLESQVIRYKTAAESSEKAEDELKIEKRKLQRENRESIARIEELETANSHLQRRMDKLKNAKSTLLKEL